MELTQDQKGKYHTKLSRPQVEVYRQFLDQKEISAEVKRGTSLPQKVVVDSLSAGLESPITQEVGQGCMPRQILKGREKVTPISKSVTCGQ